MSRRVLIRFPELDVLAQANDITTDAALATALQVSPAHLSELRSGRCNPGAVVIDGVMRVFGTSVYHRVFHREES